MPLVTCANCGHQISDLAPRCIKCGAPNAGYVGPEEGSPPPRALAPSGVPMRTVATVGALLAAGIATVGLLSSIALPDFADQAKDARQDEAVPYLKQIATLQATFRERYGTYARDANELARVGWLDPDARFFNFTVSRADAAGYCVDALPSSEGNAVGVHASSIDQTGKIHPTAGCPGAPRPAAPAPPPAEAPPADSAAR